MPVWLVYSPCLLGIFSSKAPAMCPARLELLPPGVLDLALSKLTPDELTRACLRPFVEACHLRSAALRIERPSPYARGAVASAD